MSDSHPSVLILDDGELDGLAAMLAEMGVDARRCRGASSDALPPAPRHLLVVTARRAEAAAPLLGSDDPATRPLRVAVTHEDSNALRAMLRRRGFDLLVRQRAHPEVWRLLVRRAAYRGDERRRDDRVAIGSRVSIEADAPRSGALLVDVSNRGCHLLVDGALAPGERLALTLPDLATGGPPLALNGRVVRSVARDDGRRSLGVLFDRDMPAGDRERLGALLNRWTHGVESLDPHAGGSEPLPACDSPAIPGLLLDEETDPAVLANVEVALRWGRPERRKSPRGRYEGRIEARGTDGPAVLIGRDLSAGGLRVERWPGLGVGDRLDLAIHGPDRAEPARVAAEVIRDDGEEGFALAFRDVPPDLARELEKWVACLPDVEPLQRGEISALGAVLTEVVSDPDA